MKEREMEWNRIEWNGRKEINLYQPKNIEQKMSLNGRES